MRNKIRKKYQRHFTRALRKLNKHLYNDEMMKGRFEAKQIDSKFFKFDDNSGGEFFVTFRCFDKFTKKYKDFIIDASSPYFTNWHLFTNVNNFLVDDIKWGVKYVGDFRNVKIPNLPTKNKDRNYWELRKWE